MKSSLNLVFILAFVSMSAFVSAIEEQNTTGKKLKILITHMPYNSKQKIYFQTCQNGLPKMNLIRLNLLPSVFCMLFGYGFFV